MTRIPLVPYTRSVLRIDVWLVACAAYEHHRGPSGRDAIDVACASMRKLRAGGKLENTAVPNARNRGSTSGTASRGTCTMAWQ